MNTCIVCGSISSRPLYSGILRCQECGYVYADACLTDEELVGLYRKDYFFGDEYSDYLADKRTIQKNFDQRFKTLRAFLDPARHRHLLEIGSAYGFFLEVVGGHFESVTGIDITEDGVRHGREELHLNVIQGDFLKQDFCGRKFDVVCLWDTIEHLRNPKLYLEKLSRHTQEGSLLAITTGDIESLNGRFKKSKWRLLHPPTHLHYFSRRTLEKLLGNHGFEVVYNQYCGFYRSIDNIVYNILVLRRKKPFLYDLLKRSGLDRLDMYLNMYDIMYVIARKR